MTTKRDTGIPPSAAGPTVHRRTWTIVCERPLEPQPPWNATPDWWGINDLSFHDKEWNTVWHQEIPEADIVRKAWRGDSYDLDRLGSISVRRTRKWGWLLHLEYSHDLARKAWPFGNLTFMAGVVPGQPQTCPHLKGVVAPSADGRDAKRDSSDTPTESPSVESDTGRTP